MNSDSYLNKLNISCQKLINLNCQTNHNNFSQIIPIINIFNEIKINNNEDTLFNAIALILDIKDNNPNLRGIIDAILNIININNYQNNI